MRGRSARAVALLALGVIGAPGAHAADATWRLATPSGGIQYFSTVDQLVPGDTDTTRDVYQWSSAFGGFPTLISPSPVNGAPSGVEIAGVSTDGNVLWLTTREQLSADDTDSATDIYRVAGGVATRYSFDPALPTSGNGAFDATFNAASDNGSVLAFSTDEPLTPTTDIDHGGRDIFLRNTSNQFWRASIGNLEFNGEDADFEAMTPSGPPVVFRTGDQLSAADTDSVDDLYSGTFSANATQVSVGASDDGANPAVFGHLADDGLSVWFDSADPLAAGDTDSFKDVYVRSAGTTTRLTPTNGNFHNTFAGISGDEATVFFHTNEGIDGADLDNSHQDVYARQGATTTLISRKTAGNSTDQVDATYGGSSTDGGKVLFETPEQLVTAPGADADAGHVDVYLRDTGAATTTWVSTDGTTLTGAFDAAFNGASSDAASVFFTTTEKLVPQDNDASPDIYERQPAGGVTLLRSDATASAFTTFRSTNASGSRVVFDTDAALLPTDGDTARDVYARDTGSGTLYHVSHDVNPPDTTFSGGPAGLTNDATPDFALSSEAGATFACRVDGAAFAACGAAFTPAALADGAHTVQARATDLDGNVDASPAERSFTVDTTAPETTITAGPDGVTTADPTPAFEFTSEAGATFACAIDLGAFVACASPYESAPLADGAHTLSVRATDAAGNADLSPAQRSFTVAAPTTNPPGSNPPGTTGLTVRTKARRLQRPLRLKHPAIVVQAWCLKTTCRVAAKTTIRLSRTSRLTLRAKAKRARAGKRAALRLTIGTKARRRLAHRLRKRGSRLRATVVVTGRSGTHTGRAKRRVTLAR